MTLRSRIEELFSRQVAQLTEWPQFRALESGAAARDAYDRFVGRVVRSHAKSPQLIAFLFALAPPDAAALLRHNMLEELGLADASGVAHPAMLETLARGAGLAHQLPALDAEATRDLRQIVTDPLLYGTLKEVGLAALGEVTAFEFMLARVAGRMARALGAYRGLPPAVLAWFTHHAEVDLAHAAQGLDTLESYVRYYGFAEEDALGILELALRENVFIKRYFGAVVPAEPLGV